MQNNEKLEQIRKELPLGGKRLIAERTGLSARSVENILGGKNARIKNLTAIIKEAEKVIAEYKEITGK